MTDKTALKLSATAYKAERARLIAQHRAAEIAAQQVATLKRLSEKDHNLAREK